MTETPGAVQVILEAAGAAASGAQKRVFCGVLRLRGAARPACEGRCRELTRRGWSVISRAERLLDGAQGIHCRGQGEVIWPGARELDGWDVGVSLPRVGGGHPYELLLVVAQPRGYGGPVFACLVRWGPRALRLLRPPLGGRLPDVVAQLNERLQAKLAGGRHLPPIALPDPEVQLDPVAALGRLEERCAQLEIGTGG